MSPQTLYIKNMVCQRCIEAVEEEFNLAQIPIKSIQLGMVNLESEISDEQKSSIRDALKKRGFELLEQKNSQFIEQIKNLLLKQILYQKEPLNVNYSTYLEQEIGKNYHSLSTLFSSVEGITIERFIILQKLERVKELLIYDELSLSKIAYKLNYSSVQHLSNQFKKSIGMTPSQFKKTQANMRKPLDEV
ncbi:MAG: AraC family transcriptional regulator [Bacteroidetes bacterium]|nr:AraC family transcriptional regulator [Bacteroidota bacterium]MDA1119890.1 AraC family transcriptional regulator [Bacteroidota bacterium]